MKVKYLLLATISGAVVALDQLSKIFIHTRFHLGESIEWIPGFFNITYVRNPGAAFGILATSASQFREVFFTMIPLVALLIILMILKTTRETHKSQVLALSLIFGGAIGNYIDRLRFKYVIDFLDFHIQNKYHWPAFNIADSAIVVGVGILLFQMFFVKTHHSVPGQTKETPKPEVNGAS